MELKHYLGILKRKWLEGVCIFGVLLSVMILYLNFETKYFVAKTELYLRTTGSISPKMVEGVEPYLKGNSINFFTRKRIPVSYTHLTLPTSCLV